MNTGNEFGPGSDRGPAGHIASLFARMPSLRADPAVGVLIADTEGVFRFINMKSASMFLGRTPEAVIGQSVRDLTPPRIAEERIELTRQALERQSAIVLRSIRRGVRIQSTFHPLPETNGGHVLVTSGEGELAIEHEPEEYTLVESAFVELGPLDVLSPRELEVLAMIGQGLSQIEIARVLHRSVRTIEKHRQAISSKLGEASRVTLGQLAQRAGLTVEHAAKARVPPDNGHPYPNEGSSPHGSGDAKDHPPPSDLPG